MKKKINISCLLLISVLLFTIPCIAQEGIYAGIGWNSYFAKEQVNSSDKTYQFTHSNASKHNGFLSQSLGNYGVGFQLGIRKNINNKLNKNILTLDAQYYFNYQNVLLESTFANFKIETKANYNHGYRVALGHRFNKIHPYIIVQAFYQNITAKNSAITNEGIIYDVEDDGTILPNVLDDNGGAFSNEVFSFLGGFGVEIPIKKKFAFQIEYVPMKYVEYGVKDVVDENNYFVNNLMVNQLQVGVKYYFGIYLSKANP